MGGQERAEEGQGLEEGGAGDGERGPGLGVVTVVVKRRRTADLEGGAEAGRGAGWESVGEGWEAPEGRE